MADYSQVDYRPLGSYGSSTANERYMSNAESQIRAMKLVGLDTRNFQILLELTKALHRYVFYNTDKYDDRAAR